jgi:hypothetical protein
MVGMLATRATAAPGAPHSATDFQVLNGTVDASSDHERAGSSAFPNFRHGAVDNYFTMAHAYVDNSPFSQGTGSPGDTGPMGQNVAGGQHFNQPQYADVRYPPGSSKPATAGQKGGPYAEATAVENEATALASEASQDFPGMLRAARRLSSALQRWKHRFLAPAARGGLNIGSAAGSVSLVDGLGASPTPSPSPKGGKAHDGLEGVTSSASASFDTSTGALVVSGDSRVASASFAQGMIQFRGIHVSTSITNDGVPTSDTSVEIGSAEIGGVPVTVDQDGVQVNDQKVDLSKTYKQADDALNSALKAAGVKVFTVLPQSKKSSHQLTIDATGVRVEFQQAGTPEGVPVQDVQHSLGEVFVDSLAVPGIPVSALPQVGSAQPPPSNTGGSSTRHFVPGIPGTPGQSGSLGSIGGGTSGPQAPVAAGGEQPGAMAPVVAHVRPTWLLLGYFLWQSIMGGAAASLWLARGAGAAA